MDKLGPSNRFILEAFTPDQGYITTTKHFNTALIDRSITVYTVNQIYDYIDRCSFLYYSMENHFRIFKFEPQTANNYTQRLFLYFLKMPNSIAYAWALVSSLIYEAFNHKCSWCG